MVTILIFCLVLGLIIAIHELGHFLMAKKFGVKCPVFSIGFGPKIFGFMYRGTDFRLSLLPFGGYVLMKGALEYSKKDPDSFGGRPRWQRLLIMAGGPGINFMSAFVFSILILFLMGMEVPTNKVEKAVVLNPEYKEKKIFETGDIIVSINNNPTNSGNEIIEQLVKIPPEKNKVVTIRRNGFEKTETIEPGENMSLTFTLEPKKLNFKDSVKESVNRLGESIGLQISFIKDAVTGKVDPTDQLSGPVGIIKIGVKISEDGKLLKALGIFFFAISVGVGFINLLPIPVLDGGQITILFLEAVANRDLGAAAKNILNLFGVLLLLGLTIFLTLKDLSLI